MNRFEMEFKGSGFLLSTYKKERLKIVKPKYLKSCEACHRDIIGNAVQLQKHNIVLRNLCTKCGKKFLHDFERLKC